MTIITDGRSHRRLHKTMPICMRNLPPGCCNAPCRLYPPTAPNWPSIPNGVRRCKCVAHRWTHHVAGFSGSGSRSPVQSGSLREVAAVLMGNMINRIRLATTPLKDHPHLAQTRAEHATLNSKPVAAAISSEWGMKI